VRILYCALDQAVPGTKGGSVHVAAVAEGLAARGHTVDVLTQEGAGGFPSGAARWHRMGPPAGRPQLRMLRARAVRRFAEQLRPDVVMERYYNFGGEGVRAARATGVPAALEVNAPIVDSPGSTKQLIDRALLLEPMRRWREWQCRNASLIITPSRAIVPAWIPAERVLEIEWGADATRFTPKPDRDTARDPAPVVAIFAGAFRSWHGAIHLVRAIATLRARRNDRLHAVLVGDGPELQTARDAAAGVTGITFTGAVPHDRMPGVLADADIGVAPFDVGAHGPLSIDFYWSPLKVFEYMAAGLPVVAPRITRLTHIVRDGGEGVLYDAREPEALANALERLMDSELRAQLGRAARERVVAKFSWAAHCEKLEGRLLAL
jgi:glycosyltransferase involved in cell wall biosynthesis